MRLLPLFAFLGICGTTALADGLSPMPLKKVLPQADVVVLAEISTNDVTIVKSKPGKSHASVVYTCNIKATVVEKVKASAQKELDLIFTFTVVKGVWLEWPGSGLEQNMKPKEQYVLLMTSQDDTLKLLRAERTTELTTIKTLLKQAHKKKPANKTN